VQRLRLGHSLGQTTLLAGDGALAAAAAELQTWLHGRRVFTLSSSKVRALHGHRLDALTAPAATRVDLDAPDGESAKRVSEAERLWAAMAAAGGKRDSRLITLGGGTIGDLGGFAAGTFLRGIEYAQIPTTLLAQVDAAIGGKTAIDLEAGKNLVGVFHHPTWVVADPAVLETLPLRQRRAGMMEVVKIALAADPALFAALEAAAERLAEGDLDAIAAVIAPAIQAKIRIVEKDPRESHARRALNLGHTLGHALEAADGYATLLHGEAVGWGLRFALRLSARREGSAGARQRALALLSPFPLPALPAVTAEDLWQYMKRDKKGRESGPVWVVPLEVGEAAMVDDFAPDILREELRQFIESESGPRGAASE
jgi:3-dehydroquinate synthase